MKMNVPVLESLSARTAPPAPLRSTLAALVALAALALFGGTGCAAEVHTRTAASPPATVTYQELAVTEEPVVHIVTVPAYIETYPRVYYRGTYVYYVDGRWYYPSRRGWVYYREEPRALVHYRAEFERRPPRDHVHVVHAAPSRPVAAPRVEHRRRHPGRRHSDR